MVNVVVLVISALLLFLIWLSIQVRVVHQCRYTTETNGKLDVLPILVVGEESFTTIGFNTDGKV